MKTQLGIDFAAALRAPGLLAFVHLGTIHATPTPCVVLCTSRIWSSHLIHTSLAAPGLLLICFRERKKKKDLEKGCRKLGDIVDIDNHFLAAEIQT